MQKRNECNFLRLNTCIGNNDSCRRTFLERMEFCAVAVQCSMKQMWSNERTRGAWHSWYIPSPLLLLLWLSIWRLDWSLVFSLVCVCMWTVYVKETQLILSFGYLMSLEDAAKYRKRLKSTNHFSRRTTKYSKSHFFWFNPKTELYFLRVVWR